jgi:hypothetical protein
MAGVSSVGITTTVPRPWYGNFLLGGAGACSGWMLVHPFDLLKVRKQLAMEGGGGAAKNVGLATMARSIVATEGVSSHGR